MGSGFRCSGPAPVESRLPQPSAWCVSQLLPLGGSWGRTEAPGGPKDAGREGCRCVLPLSGDTPAPPRHPRPEAWGDRIRRRKPLQGSVLVAQQVWVDRPAGPAPGTSAGPCQDRGPAVAGISRLWAHFALGPFSIGFPMSFPRSLRPETSSGPPEALSAAPAWEASDTLPQAASQPRRPRGGPPPPCPAHGGPKTLTNGSLNLAQNLVVGNRPSTLVVRNDLRLLVDFLKGRTA